MDTWRENRERPPPQDHLSHVATATTSGGGPPRRSPSPPTLSVTELVDQNLFSAV
ncbi:hypothetical protein M569_11383 [Genlisea aurea]|uniref:Uncharacterized protein n=1 Tax=Genlisea aurea TaxID=192259 RepID=S8DU69_9LAMI|nr:hypothetical protein M569_11383 [Genlisea aurea]